MNLVSRLIISCFCGALIFESSVAFSQPTVETISKYRIGWLSGGSPATSGRYFEAFRDALRTYGHVDGRDVAIELRYAVGEYGRLPALANELVAQKVNLIVVGNEQALIAAKNTLAPIPIVAVTCDPLEKLVGSLARPGGNATGVTCVSADLVGKRFGYLKTLVPSLKRIAYLYNPEDDVDAEFRGAEVAGKALGVTPIRFPVRSSKDFTAAFNSMDKQRCQALYVSVSAFTNYNRQRLADLALSHHLPAINGFPEFPEAGGLISYGASLTDGFKRAAYFVDRIMKGASPKDLPVEEPMKFYLFVNAKTAKKLGIKIPDLIVIQADTIIK
jgi:putative ABC transport system substrate-binding protein